MISKLKKLVDYELDEFLVINWKGTIVLCTEMNLIDYELIQNCLTTNWYECLTVHWKKMFTVKCYVNEWNGKLNEQGTEMKVFKEMFN